jgi:hypothetical protein
MRIEDHHAGKQAALGMRFLPTLAFNISWNSQGARHLLNSPAYSPSTELPDSGRTLHTQVLRASRCTD